MQVEFTAEIWYWRGPAPHHFVSVPEKQSEELRGVAEVVSYGWGMIPVRARIGKTEWKTSLFPKDGGYVVPIKATVRKDEAVNEGDSVTIQLDVNL